MNFPSNSHFSVCKKPNQNTLSTNQNKTSVTQLDFDTNSSLTFNNIPSVNTLPKREHLSLSFTSCSTTRRQLPRTPSPEDPLIEIISNASRERILNVLRQTHKLLRQGQEAENRNSIFSRMNCPGNFDDNNLLKVKVFIILPSSNNDTLSRITTHQYYHFFPLRLFLTVFKRNGLRVVVEFKPWQTISNTRSPMGWISQQILVQEGVDEYNLLKAAIMRIHSKPEWLQIILRKSITVSSQQEKMTNLRMTWSVHLQTLKVKDIPELILIARIYFCRWC